ncbi:energy-coupling factor transporter transmembrane component T [Clostridium sporogenes]
MKIKKFSLDPRTKLILLISTNMILMGEIPKWVEISIVIFYISLLILYNLKNIALKFGIVYLVMLLGELYLMPYTNGALQMVIALFVVMFRRFIPCFLIGYMSISTTTVSEFVASMERMHITKKIIIPFCVMFRFFPTVKEEWESIQDAMQMRGVRVSMKNILKSPINMLEYMFVPLLSSAVKIGEELSAASLARGLDGRVKRTNICKIGFFIQDIITIIFCLIFLILSTKIGRLII